MPSLVLELQQLASESSTPPVDLLLKATMVASKLGLQETVEWLAHESRGYPDSAELPEYRCIRGRLMYRNFANGGTFPLVADDPTLHKLSTVRCRQPLAELVGLLGPTKDAQLHCLLPAGAVHYIIEYFFDGNSSYVSPLLTLSASSVYNVIEQVRARVLAWALALEASGISGEGLTFTTDERSIAQAIPSVNIGNFMGILGNVSHSTVQQDLRGPQGLDAKQLAAHLREILGLDDDDDAALKAALEEEPKAIEGKLGPRVAGWIGSIVAKGARGLLKVGSDVAARVATNALLAYYRQVV